MGYYEDRQSQRAKEYQNLTADVRNKLEKELPRKEVSQQKDITWTSRFTEIAKEANEFAKEWNKSIKDVRVEHSHYDDYGSTCVEVHLEVEGLETDEQYHARLAEYYEGVKFREEHDRKEFERLRAKFAK